MEEHGEKAVKLGTVQRYCVACESAGRTVSMTKTAKKRKAFDESSPFTIRNNTKTVADGSTASTKVRRPSRSASRYGCAICDIYLCRSVRCWVEHLDCISTTLTI